MTASQRHSLADAIALFQSGRPEAAGKICRLILSGEPHNFDANYLLGTIELNFRNFAAAEQCLTRAAQADPQMADVWALRGNTLIALERLDDALASFDHALKAKPGFLGVLYNRAKLLRDMGRNDEALAGYDQVLAIDPNFREALNNRGNILMTLGRHAEAAESFARLARADPNFEHALGNRVHAMQQICAWDGLAELLGELGTRVRAGKPVATPWVMAAASDSAADQLRCAQMFTRDLYPPAANPLWRGERYAHDRIRVCYVSADFHDHATASLIAGLFEAHDRTRFEPIAISLGPDRQGGLRNRIESAFERFTDMRTNSDAEIAAHIRQLEVDIAIDLKGFTRNCRPGIFARRPAPVQVSYLGYPGTMGAPYMDYIIADRHVIPADQQAFYAERVVYLPDSYQINDDKREISCGAPTRADAGLPESGFVFCCFNRSYKITPDVFDVWMRLLTKVPGSVLWLFEGFPAAAANLRAEAEKRGVAPERLVFAPPRPLADHLGRHRLADLFLDTVPCNAHTTASDALWAGLPVVTCLGSTFAGRVAASLLHAVGLPELATGSLDQYEALASKLAGEPALLAELKARLAANLATAPLFDTARTCRNIEAAYSAMWRRQQRGDAPAGFSID